ncbi:fructoselysine-6-P-deglycase FrlB-like protein/hydroxymethylpyrimidine pyrophosphatase-like HAD family hydrolase [Sphingomonas kyeonggiensis]|uniref:Fructoselysine-6-P-deglycase FrlB-like protein/hydroxymethylpyrimidine pyrophosphatase-like HAD family hydrolase n=1 Tax=Sphingomonas kyeonggiensis TaxID=1268553 RepID=A0A7W7NTI0_9SPHN|nr:HAD hydrolase family protein [Sphingomonas kyeonggiensis]MBB4841325.1 fructoselysine-6-P-deglycase FrlB-like protein/hydroxymethylpyrimidine pyrophosphatase-like HAD family hydrolase [Sphingomonas kyeonggiensis]
MTRFAEKLDTLLGTAELVAATNLDSLAGALRGGRARPTIAIGSGGSAITARYFARCRETLFAQGTEVVTPVEFVLGNRDLAAHDVWLFSAGADNPDSVASVIAARARGAAVRVLTRNVAGSAAVAARAQAGSEIFEVPVIETKDGFLATHSLVGSVVALLLAADQVCDDPIGEGLAARALQDIALALAPEARATMRVRFADLGRNDLLLLIADPGVRAIAELIETSAWEAAIGPVQLTDVRNFAHGRHSWLHHRSRETFVVALTGHETLKLWERAAAILPDVRNTSLDFGDGGRLRNAIGLVEGLTIVESMGAAVGIDPGKPGIGDFGRALYDDDGLLTVSRELSPAIRHKQAALLARDEADGAGRSIRAAAAERREALSCAAIGGIVLDYDGTIISDEERYGTPRKEIVDELVRLDSIGVRLGIATGRGDSGGKALREVLPAELHPRVTMGYYNGAYVQPLTVDIEKAPPPIDADLAETFAWLQAQPQLFVGEFGGRFSNVQISVKLENLVDNGAFFTALKACAPVESGRVKFARSGHSIDFFAAGTSKKTVIDRVRNGLPEDSAVLCVGDSGARSGNDHELLSHSLGVSVGTVCGRHEGCWSLFGAELTGPEALLRLLGSVQRDVHGIVRINVSALGLDSFCEMGTNGEHDAPAA